MLGKSYYIFVVLSALGFALTLKLTITEITVFQKGIVVKALITNTPGMCTTRNNVVKFDYNNAEYSLLIGYSTCRDNKYVVGDSAKIRIIVGERRSLLPDSDPRAMGIICCLMTGVVFFYLLLNHKTIAYGEDSPDKE